jgi:radical SAM protein with 4Fe4S-binding SPASM domain
LLGKSIKELRQRELPLEVYSNFVDQVRAAGFSPLWYIWGGEPMMYPGLFDLLRKIGSYGMPVTMVSNGSGVAKRLGEIMDTCKILWLSLDGPDAETHNGARPGTNATADNFASVCSAMESLHAEKRRRKTPFPLVMPITVVNRYNVDRLVDIYRLASQLADAHIFYLSWWIDEPSAEAHTADFKRRFGFEPYTHTGWQGDWKDFDYELVHDRLQEMRSLSRRRENCPVMVFPNLESPEQIRRYYTEHQATFGFRQCVSIYMCMEVNSNGDVSLCRDYHDYVIGNIARDPLTSMWNGKAACKFRQSVSTEGLMPVCTRCCGLMGF